MRQFQHTDTLRHFVRNPLVRAAPVAVLCLTVMAGTAQAKRLALVVGNSEYEKVYALKNAAKDAKDVAKALKRLDFEVTLLTDTDEQDFWTKLEDFAKRAEADDVESTLFYFSGHAFQLDGANYLVPVDAALTSREAIENNTWRLDEIVKRLEDRDRQTLIFLDACRNNPLPESQRAGGGEGLAKLETGSGTFVAFATQPNNVTADGAGDNSPFTQALLSSIETEGISISDMMIRVRNNVEDATYGRQTPWDQSSLRAQFYFKPVVERSASLTQADYEMIASLDAETRNRLLAALGNAGLQVEDAEVEEQLEAKVAAANPAFFIEDVTDEATDALSTSPEDVAAVAPKDSQPAFVILDPDQEAVVAQRPAAGSAGSVVAVATPTVRVQQPKESSISVIPSEVPLNDATGATRALADAAARAATSGTATAASSADTATALAAQPATSGATSERTAALSAETIGTTQSGEAVAATGAVDATTGVRVADALPADPNAGREITTVADDAALILAALSPTRSLAPIFGDRSRVEGEELSREDAEAVGIKLPDETLLEGKPLARAVQVELARLGCYRSGIDGLWGKGSALALVRYYGNKGVGANDLNPSNALLRLLVSEPKVICEVAAEQKNQRVAKAKAKIRKTRAPEVKKAAAKPTTKTKRIVRTRTVTNKAGKTEKKTIKRLNTGVFR